MRPQWGLRAELTEAAAEAARKKSCFPHQIRMILRPDFFCLFHAVYVSTRPKQGRDPRDNF